MIASQIPMDFDFRSALGREDFLVAPPNQEAIAWIDRWPDWPGPFLLIQGPGGSGKTHLAHVWQQRAGARVVNAASLAHMGIEALTDLIRTPIVLENVDATTDEEKLFHLYNLVKENSGFMILTSRTGPAQWDLGLPDLKSRMGAIQIVRITEPDDSLFAAVLLKLFTDRQLSVSPDVLQYLIARLERSFGEAQRVVAAIDELSLAEKRKITIPLVRNLLGTEKD